METFIYKLLLTDSKSLVLKIFTKKKMAKISLDEMCKKIEVNQEITSYESIKEEKTIYYTNYKL